MCDVADYRRLMVVVRRRDRWTFWDVALAVLVLVVGLGEVLTGQLVGPRWASVSAVAALALSLLVRRPFIWVAVPLSFAAIVLSFAVGVVQDNFAASVLACLAVLSTAGYSLELRSAVLALIFGFVCVAVATSARDVGAIT